MCRYKRFETIIIRNTHLTVCSKPQPTFALFYLFVGVPRVTLDFIGPFDLAMIAKLQVALGRAMGAARRFAASVTCFQNAVQVR